MKQKALLLFLTGIFAHSIPLHAQQSAPTSDTFISEGIFKDLSKPEYARDILPNDFSHLTTLLDHCKKANKSRAYVERIFRVFGRLLKGAHYVNAYAFSDMLEQLPNLLEHYFTVYTSRAYAGDSKLLNLEPIDRFKEVVNRTLYSRFLNEYDLFKKNSDSFFDMISSDIFEIVAEEATIDQLRQTIIRFLEVGFSKLVWSPEDHDQIWQSVKSMSQKITSLMEHYVVEDDDDVNDLFWTLTHRFCFFLDITGSTLPAEFYENIKQDIAAQQLELLELEEQEHWLETKSNCLKRTLLTAEARSRAYQHGIITK